SLYIHLLSSPSPHSPKIQALHLSSASSHLQSTISMAGKSIVPFVGSESTYGLNGDPSPANQTLASPPSFSEPCSGRRGNAHCHDTAGDHASIWEEDNAEGRRGGGGRPPGSAEPGRRALGLPFGTTHRQEGYCPEGQGKAPRDYAVANDGRTSPKGCRRSPLRRPDASDAHGRGNAACLHREEQKRRRS